MKTVLMADPVRFPRMTSQEVRDAFLIQQLHRHGELHMAYVDLDRAVIGIAAPAESPITLPSSPELRAEYFTQRRELGILNVGGPATVHIGDSSYRLENLDVLYIGRGNPEIRFESGPQQAPPLLYLLSYPAHTEYPVALIRQADAQPMETGSPKTCNHRTIYKYIHSSGAKSCQLVMGVTHLHEGSSWNTMPAHTHMRRSEIYFYFDVAQDARVFHLMGPPQETRHIVLNNAECVVSPGWSIHAGVGTQAYKFCWGMGGENQDYADMDPVPIDTMR
ncbi:5-dehydro-4-deoxy-D-glucuronate isomerase [Acidobacteria bacterium AB60]|nr:5-dehydro-4-deoxy-D-glucuronate isomerase [Acidobacteria bacterium AB60]